MYVLFDLHCGLPREKNIFPAANSVSKRKQCKSPKRILLQLRDVNVLSAPSQINGIMYMCTI